MLPNDISVNKTLSKYGADHILQLFNDEPVDILTHCNTGSLATAGYGTALGKSSYTHSWPWAHETKISSCIPSLIFHFFAFWKRSKVSSLVLRPQSSIFASWCKKITCNSMYNVSVVLDSLKNNIYMYMYLYVFKSLYYLWGFFYIKGAWAWFYFLLFMFKMVYFLILNNWPKFDTVIIIHCYVKEKLESYM